MPSNSHMNLNRYNFDLRRGRDNYWRHQQMNNNVIEIDDDAVIPQSNINTYYYINGTYTYNHNYNHNNNIHNIVNIDDEPLPAPPPAAAPAPPPAPAPPSAVSQKQRLVTLMSLVDDESERLTEGTYLIIVNILKEMYLQETKQK